MEAGHSLDASQRRQQRQRPPVSNPKFERIDIWRSEVNSTRIYCVCSAPATPGLDSHGASKDALPISTSSTAVGSDSRAESTHQFPVSPIPTTSNVSSDYHWETSQISHQPPAQPEARRSKLAISKKGLPDDRQICAVCSSRVDTDVSYMSFKEDGTSGFIRTNRSPRSVASIKKLKEVVSSKNYKTPRSMRVERAIKAPFKRLKNAALPVDDTSRRRRIVTRLFGDPKQPKPSTDDEQKTHPRATEMYYLLRPDVDPGSVETLAGLSDDERRKPGLTIDQAAARLRRASKLLGKTSKIEP
ncbi:hypothetical protein AAE478_000958 [Parahypoxylon ruwenzoriense]